MIELAILFDTFILSITFYYNKLRNETNEHKMLKKILSSKLEEWLNVSLTEYHDSGHRLDVFAISTNGISIMIEIIWTATPTNFIRDLLIFLESDANIKIVIVNKQILSNDNLIKQFKKSKIKEIQQGVIVSDLIDGNKLLEDENYLNQDFKNILYNLIDDYKSLSETKLDKLKERILTDESISSILSICIGIARKRGNKEKEEWLINELYGYTISEEFNSSQKGEQLETVVKKLPNNPQYRILKFKMKFMSDQAQVEKDFPLFFSKSILELEELNQYIQTSTNASLIITLPLNQFSKHNIEVFRIINPNISSIPLELPKNELQKFFTNLRLKIHKFIDDID